jgi:signal transduction histidine kinase
MEPAARSLLSVAQSVLGELDVETVLGRVLQAARELTGARYAAVGVLDDSREGLSQFVYSGIDEDLAELIGPLPRGRGLLGELIAEPRPLRLADMSAHPHSYGFPPNHPPMRSFLGVPVVVQGEPFGNLYLTEKQDAGEFSAEDEDAAILLAEFAGLAIDHARRFTGSEKRRMMLQHAVRALEATIDITRAVAGESDVEAILSMVAKRGRALVSARALLIEVQRDGELLIAAGAGEVPDGAVGSRVPLENTVASTALRTRHTQRLSDELNRTRFLQHGAGTLGVRAQEGLVVPLVFRTQAYGVLMALDRTGEAGPGFTLEDQRLLEAFAASAAMAISTAESAAAQRRRQAIEAAEAERQRWARELHDETLQALAALRLALVGARRTGTPEAMGAAIDHAVEQLHDDVSNLRSMITDLRPAALDELGPGAAIQALAARTRTRGLEVEAHLDLAYERGEEPERHVPELEIAIYRTVQEALSNAVKHSGAARAEVTVAERDATVTVTVRDDGQGFDPFAATAGFGLLGMRERIELLDGSLEIDSEPGRGCTIRATFPVRRRAPGGVIPDGARRTGYTP